jgi:hypothetical protein
MNTSGVDLEVPRAEAVTVTSDTLVVELNDGRTISVPLAWFPDYSMQLWTNEICGD